VKQEKVTRHGDGKRGSPYTYFHFSFSCSQDIAGTREQETQEVPEARENTSGNLVPTLEQKSFLVPENVQAQKPGSPDLKEQPLLNLETGQDVMEF
jgi:hypothetical protein